MTCDEFAAMAMRDLDKGVNPGWSLAEINAAIKHMHECPACDAAVNHGSEAFEGHAPPSRSDEIDAIAMADIQRLERARLTDPELR